MKKHLDKLVGKTLSLLVKFRSKYLAEPETDELELSDVHSVFEDYIGLIVIKFDPIYEDIEDLSSQLCGKMLTSVSSNHKEVRVGFSDLQGHPSGELIVFPAISSQFVEKMYEHTTFHWATQYRIVFVGGACIEYVDTQSIGTIIWKGV